MTFEELEKMSVIDLKEFLNETKTDLLIVISKLDINIVRAGVMSLVNSNSFSIQSLIETGDVLYNISNLLIDLSACKYELNRRKTNA